MDKSEVTLERMRTFVRIAERASLSAVAREFGVAQSTITRHLRELEEAVGVPLISRTTRRLRMTEEGSRYYTSAVQILDLVQQAGEGMRAAHRAAAGTIRISCTSAFGVLHVSRIVFAFQARYPDIGIDLSLTDERVDLVREGIDIAIRLGPLVDSSLKLRTLGHSRRILVASPDYLASKGHPDAPGDLARHETVRMSNVAGSDQLMLVGPDARVHTVVFEGRLRVDHGLAAREAFIAGRGIGLAHVWLVEDLLADGSLKMVLPGYMSPPVPLSILLVPERAGISRVRLFADFLAGQVSRIPGISSHGPGSGPARASVSDQPD